MTDNSLELKIRIAENELRREAEQAGQTVRDGFGAEPISLEIDTGVASSDLQTLAAQLLNAKAALSEGDEAIALQKQAGLLQESLRYKQQLAAIDGAGLSEEDAAIAKRLADELNRLNVDRISRDFDQLGDSAKSNLSGIDALVDNLVAGIGQGLGQSLTNLGGNLLGSIGQGFTSIIEKGANLEQISIAFETITGSAEAGQAAIQDLVNFAATTPFELPSIQKSGQSLLAFGFQAEELTDVLGRVGNVAAGVSQPIDELAVIYGKARVSGRLFAEDINQLTERGIPIIQELAKQFGVTEGEVKGLVESGQVGFSNLEQAFIDLTSEGGSFFNLMERQSESVGGKISNFGDNVGKLQTQIFDAIAPVLSGGLDAANTLLNGIISLIDGFQKLPAPIQLALLGVTGFTATLSAGIVVYSAYQIASQTAAAQLLKQNAAQVVATASQIKNTVATTAATAAKSAYAIATGQATAAQLQFIATVAKSVLTLGLLAAAAGVIYNLVDSFNVMTESSREARETADSLRDGLDELGNTGASDSIDDLADATGDHLTSELEKAREELNAFQRILDDLIISKIPGLTTAAEQVASDNVIAFGEIVGATDDVLDKFDEFRSQGLDSQSEEDLAELTAKIEQAQEVLENAEIPENMRASAQVYIDSLERARAELEQLNAEQAASGNQGGSFGDAFAGAREDYEQRIEEERQAAEEAAEAAIQARLDGVRQANELAASERERAQTEEIAAVRAQVASRLITEEQAQQQIAEIRQRGLDNELAAVEEQIGQVEQLRAEGALSQEEATQQIADLEAEAAGIRLEQIDAEIEAQEALRAAEIDRLNETLETERSLAEERQANIDQSINALRQESEVLSARAGLQKAQADLANQRLQAEIEAAEAAGDTQSAEELRGDLLEQQAEQLAEQQEIEREQLRISQEQNALELQRQAVLAEIATTEAEIALQQAITEGATSAEVANLERMLSLRQQQEQFVSQSAQQQAELNELANRELATRQQIAQEALSAERSLNAGNVSSAESRSVERRITETRIGGGEGGRDQPQFRGIGTTTDLSSLLAAVNQGNEQNRSFLETVTEAPRETTIPGLDTNLSRVEGLLNDISGQLSRGVNRTVEVNASSSPTDPAELAKIARALE